MIEAPNFGTKAACNSEDPDLFFPTMTHELGLYRFSEAEPIAKSICNSCEVKKECFDWAVVHEEYGIWGGTTPTEREIHREKHGMVFVSPYTSWDWYNLFKNEIDYVDRTRGKQQDCCDTPIEELSEDKVDPCYACWERLNDYRSETVVNFYGDKDYSKEQYDSKN